jgi:hypothetical protein
MYSVGNVEAVPPGWRRDAELEAWLPADWKRDVATAA